MDYDALKFWLDAFNLVCLFAVSIYVWQSNKYRANKNEIEALRSEVVLLVNRVSLVEDRVRNSPTHSDIGQLYDRMNGISNDMSEMSGTMKAMVTQLGLINEYLMKGDK